ncbi:MAG: beta-ketoacyl-[acyl-carrier-protein] synthase family protein [Candidatus Omnitrophica bacterium]|nr:beta-ketoacyl-[acyl-carrier-protein] synthase family protein [Candidatus Omnitrophota bacterium]
MSKKRVVITGLGIISSLGVGKAAFTENIFQGVSGIKPIATFDTALFSAKSAGEARDFSPEAILGPKGLRTLDRSIKLVASATKLALEDSCLEITESNSRDVGVAIGTTLGSVASISDFDREALKEGPRYVNPALFPNTVINSPASQVSIKFNIKGFNVTISTGFSASLDALNYGVDALRFGRAKIVLGGGVEEFCIQTFLGFYKSGCLSGPGAVILGEGSGIIVLEELDSALARKAKIYAEVLGFGSALQDFKKSMRLSLEEAGLAAEKIDYINSAANSSAEFSAREAKAIEELFGKKAGALPVSSIKPLAGESFSASGSLQVAAAISAIERQKVPPSMLNQAQSPMVEHVLINTGGKSGVNSSLIISKFKGY